MDEPTSTNTEGDYYMTNPIKLNKIYGKEQCTGTNCDGYRGFQTKTINNITC